MEGEKKADVSQRLRFPFPSLRELYYINLKMRFIQKHE
nr:MAG TPA: hypothetical protein [Caudoviricetes sp.]